MTTTRERSDASRHCSICFIRIVEACSLRVGVSPDARLCPTPREKKLLIGNVCCNVFALAVSLAVIVGAVSGSIDVCGCPSFGVEGEDCRELAKVFLGAGCHPRAQRPLAAHSATFFRQPFRVEPA